MEEEGDGSCGVMVLEGGGDEVAVDEGSSGISGRDKPSEAALTAAALLIRAVRRCDEAEVARLVAGGMDVNAEVEVEGAEFVPQEELLYPSTALLEAARTRHLPVLAAVLAAPGIDVNCRTTHMGMTPFADACFRGDAEMAGVLMRDSRVDVALGDSVRLSVGGGIIMGCPQHKLSGTRTPHTLRPRCRSCRTPRCMPASRAASPC